MKSKLLPILLFLLILLNGILIYMLISKPHQNRKERAERSFLTSELQFSDAQKDKFSLLDKSHREQMIEIDKSIREHKDVLFNSFQKENVYIDSLTNRIGLLEGKKEAEVYRFFSKVRTLCNENQAKEFDVIIKKALRTGDNRPPRDRRMPPPEDGRHHPPR